LQPFDAKQFAQALFEEYFFWSRDTSRTDLAAKKAILLIGKVVEAARTVRGELYTHDRFFKETQTNRLIHETIEAAYPTATAKLSES
jgi:hypothetical protein